MPYGDHQIAHIRSHANNDIPEQLGRSFAAPPTPSHTYAVPDVCTLQHPR